MEAALTFAALSLITQLQWLGLKLQTRPMFMNLNLVSRQIGCAAVLVGEPKRMAELVLDVHNRILTVDGEAKPHITDVLRDMGISKEFNGDPWYAERGKAAPRPYPVVVGSACRHGQALGAGKHDETECAALLVRRSESDAGLNVEDHHLARIGISKPKPRAFPHHDGDLSTDPQPHVEPRTDR